jgi:hypothetical protein
MSDDDDVAPELPFDYQELRRSYRWPLSYGPWALGIIGLILIGVGLVADRPGEVALAAIGFGAGMVIAGVLLPRMHGQLELGPSGVKGAVQGLPEALMVTAAMTAREVAEATIPAEEPEKERKVNEAVGRVVTDWDRIASQNLGSFAGAGISILRSPGPFDWLTIDQLGEGSGIRRLVEKERGPIENWSDDDWIFWFRMKLKERHLFRNRSEEAT